MDSIKTFIEKIKDVFKHAQNKKPLFFLFIGLFGVALIMISEIFPEKENQTDTYNFSETEIFSKQEEYLETRLENAVSKIKGAGKTDVTVTLESSKEFCYAKNFSENTDVSENSKEDEFVIIDGKNGEEAILIKTLEAEIRGVLVVCEGGNDALLKEKIINSVCALLDIPSNKVNVAEMA